jgi:hypothetical protein
VKFTAKLVTERKLERPIQRFAPDLINADGLGRQMLEHYGVEGDRVEITESKPILIYTLVVKSRLSNGEFEVEKVSA